jgi:hypothetical protein
LVLNPERVRNARKRAAVLPRECASCINAYHCARGCPDVCLLAEPVQPLASAFRCRVAQLLTAAWVLGAVRSIQAEEAKGAVLGDYPALRNFAGGPVAGVGSDAEVEVDG